MSVVERVGEAGGARCQRRAAARVSVLALGEPDLDDYATRKR